jgi:NAD-dependent deacetylase
MAKLELRRYKNIVVLTGAGISVASGLRPYRGPDGLWSEEGTAKFSTAEYFDSDPDVYWQFWGHMRQAATAASPNEAHRALAQWEKQLEEGQKLCLITQNVDELHQRAGSSNVVELHGSIFRTRCSNIKCSLPVFSDSEFIENKSPKCARCGSPLRPDVVLFGEALPSQAEWLAKRALRDCELSPASRFVEWAKYALAHTVLINLEKANPHNPAFDQELIGKAEDILPELLK